MAIYRAVLAHIMDAEVEGQPTIGHFLELIYPKREDTYLWRLTKNEPLGFGQESLNVFLSAPGIEDLEWRGLLHRTVHWVQVIGNSLILHEDDPPNDPTMGAAIVGHSGFNDDDIPYFIQWIDPRTEEETPAFELPGTSSVLTYSLLLCPAQSELYTGTMRRFQIQHGGHVISAPT